ncbi:MAG: response regulator [Cytophaga sp.]|uniref:response regulator n=1 Tax=Cytophaga sp. TaxID=29535 RepID=UPI003F81AAC9
MKPHSRVDILLAEDSFEDADLTIRALKKKNLADHLLHLEDGTAVLDFIFSPEGLNIPKLILLDLKMPKLNGIEVIHVLKSDERTKSIPITVLTSSKEGPDIEACYKLGVNSYIIKPVEFDKFVDAVTELGLYWLILNQLPR